MESQVNIDEYTVKQPNKQTNKQTIDLDVLYRYTQLKELTDNEISKANSIFESMLTSHEHDKATADNEKKAIDIQINSAAEALELKKQQNTELNNICQELMGAFNT